MRAHSLAVVERGQGLIHWQWLSESGELAVRRRDRLAQRTREVVDRAARRWVWHESHAEAAIATRLDEIGAGVVSPYELAAEIVATLREGERV